MKVLTIALALTNIVSIIALAWVLGTPAPDDPRIGRLEADLKEARQTISQLRRDLANRSVSPAPSPTSKSSAKIALETPAANPPSAQGGTAGALREMMKNPAMRDLLGQQQAAQIETGYARLFEYLKLNDEEKAHFKKLLTERAKVEADLALKMLDPNLTPQQRQQLLAEAEKNKNAFDQTIRGFLNNDADWNNFQSFEATRPERTQFETMGRSLFAATGEPLTGQQEDQLIQLMAQIRQNPSPEQAALAKSMQSSGSMNETNLQSYLEFQKTSNARALEQAAGFLSPSQLRALQSYQQQLLGNLESGYRMGSLLMQSKGGN
jgi:DNA replication protein DnaD